MPEPSEPHADTGEQASSPRDRGSAPTPSADAGSSTAPSEVDDGLDPAMPFQEPARRQQLGRYVVLGKLGRGGMGTVLEAFDRTLDRRVALKVLHRDLDEEHTTRLLREAQALAKLSHPHVVQVYEVGEANGQAFIAMELVQGRSLRKWIARDPRPGWRECVQVYVQAGEGLAAAHARGLVHRDFKPGNAVIDEEGRVRVLDFGLARRAEDAEATTTNAQASVDVSALEQSLTRPGALVGTPAYMAPEQLQGLEADARSDQFGYCVALYEALYGGRPFEGSSMAALQVSMISGRVRSVPKGTDVPASLRAVVLRGLAIDPAQRWPSMDALLVELRRAVSPRRRGWLGLGVAVGLVAMGIGIAQYAKVGFRCEGASAQLEGIWDDERRQAVRDAILGTELSYAPDTWERVAQGLDEYASAWADEHTEVCEATSVRQEQSPEVMDLRMECLRERRVVLREAVSVLAQADATRVKNAVELVTSLPGLARCDDVEALRAELPPPEDPEVAAQVEALRERLAQTRTLRKAGDYREALAVAEPLVEQAAVLGYAPLSTEALLERSNAWDLVGRYAEAEQDAEQAYLLAAEHGHARVAASAVTHLAWVVGRRQARHEAGLQWGKTALALARGRQLEPTVEGRVLEVVGNVLTEQGKQEQALDCFRRSLAIKEKALGPDHLDVAFSLNGVGKVLWSQGKLDEALVHARRVLAIREQALGPGHPSVANALGHVGAVLDAQGKLDEALAHARRALEIGEQALGPDHPYLANWLDNVGNALSQQGELAQALPHFERALAIREQALGPAHAEVAFSHDSIGHVLGLRGQLAEAQTHYERGLAIREQALGPRHPDVAMSLVGSAWVALQKQDAEAARAPAERAVSILEASEVPPYRLAEARFLLAQALGPDRSERAGELARQARDAYLALGDVRQVDLAKVEAWLAEHPAP
jgi:tetratricopeptide (TPR) repeat protein/tRNA A-37 threonylcarbamoyl transferase component Bud32